jgi:hypothetical protein
MPMDPSDRAWKKFRKNPCEDTWYWVLFHLFEAHFDSNIEFMFLDEELIREAHGEVIIRRAIKEEDEGKEITAFG